MLPPARSSGATLSDDGISLAVVGQSCAEVHPAGASAPGRPPIQYVARGRPVVLSAVHFTPIEPGAQLQAEPPHGGEAPGQ